MAISSADLAETVVGSAQQAQTGEKKQASTEQKRGAYTKSEDRSLFIREMGTGVELDRHGRPTEKREEEWKGFSPELRQQYETFLNGYVGSLAKLAKDNPAILELPSKKDEKLILQLLKKDGEDAIDPTKLKNLLDKNSNWELVTQVIEQQNSYKSEALGLVILGDVIRGADKGYEQTIRTGERQGALNRVLHDIQPHLVIGGLTGVIYSELAAIAVLSQQLRGPALAVAGGAALLVAGAAIGRSASAEGNKSLLQERPALLKKLQEAATGNPLEAAYFKHMYGIDVKDFDFSSGRTERKKDAAGTIGVDKLIKEVKQGIHTRRQFYTELGYPPTRIDATAESFLFSKDTKHRREDIRSDLLMRVYTEYERLDKQTPASSSEERFKLWQQARKNIIIEKTTQLLDGVDKGDNIGQGVAALGEKKKLYESETEKTKRTKEVDDKVKKLSEQKAELTPKQESYTTYEQRAQQLKDLQKKLQEEQGRLTKEFSTLIFPPNLTPETVSQYVADAALLLNAKLNNPAGNGLEQQLTKLLKDKEDEISTELKNRLGAISGDPKVKTVSEAVQTNIEAQARKAAGLRFDRRIENLQQQIQQVENQAQGLRSLASDYKATEEARIKAEADIVGQAPKKLKETLERHAYFIFTTGATIDPDKLRNMTLDELIPLAKNPPYNIRTNTPEEAEKLRNDLLRAKVEQKAEDVEKYDKPPTPTLDALNDLVSRGDPISFDDLLTKDINHLLDLTTKDPYKSRVSLTPDQWKTKIELARAEATKMLRIRYQIEITERIEDIDKQTKALGKEKEKLLDTKSQKEHVDTVLALAGRKRTIYSEGTRALLGNIGQYTSIDKPKPSDINYTTLSQQEQAAGLPKGYYEMLNLLSGYREEGNKGEAFDKAQKVLPPDKMAKLLNESLKLGLVERTWDPDKQLSIENVFKKFSTGVAAQTHTWIDVRESFQYVINHLVDEAHAL